MEKIVIILFLLFGLNPDNNDTIKNGFISNKQLAYQQRMDYYKDKAEKKDMQEMKTRLDSIVIKLEQKKAIIKEKLSQNND